MKENRRKLHGDQTTNRARDNLKIHLILVLCASIEICGWSNSWNPETIRRYIQNQS